MVMSQLLLYVSLQWYSGLLKDVNGLLLNGVFLF